MKEEDKYVEWAELLYVEHLPSSRVRLSDKELRSEGLISSDNGREINI